jgi:hypothetical protein
MDPIATKEQLLAEAESVTFHTTRCSLLRDAIRDYEAAQPTLDQGDESESEDAWSVLANQLVGHETF